MATNGIKSKTRANALHEIPARTLPGYRFAYGTIRQIWRPKICGPLNWRIVVVGGHNTSIWRATDTDNNKYTGFTTVLVFCVIINEA